MVDIMLQYVKKSRFLGWKLSAIIILLVLSSSYYLIISSTMGNISKEIETPKNYLVNRYDYSSLNDNSKLNERVLSDKPMVDSNSPHSATDIEPRLESNNYNDNFDIAADRTAESENDNLSESEKLISTNQINDPQSVDTEVKFPENEPKIVDPIVPTSLPVIANRGNASLAVTELVIVNQDSLDSPSDINQPVSGNPNPQETNSGSDVAADEETFDSKAYVGNYEGINSGHNGIPENAPYLLWPPNGPGIFILNFAPVVHAKNNISYCWIHKNCHSQFKAILCADRNPALKRLTKEATAVHGVAGCVRTETVLPNHNNDSAGLYSSAFSQSWHRLTVLRDPFDRFISGYIDRCLRLRQCHHCENVHCFARRTAEIMARISKGARNVIPSNAPVNHLLPQYWYCDFQQHMDDYEYLVYSKDESFGVDARSLLIDWGFNSQLVMSSWGENGDLAFLESSTKHASSNSTASTVQAEILEDMETVEILYKTYAIDYHQFKQFSFPNWLVDQCHNLGSDYKKYEICRRITNVANLIKYKQEQDHNF